MPGASRILSILSLAGLTAAGFALTPRNADACAWAYPIGDAPNSPSPLSNNHPVGGMNLPNLGTHLGADYWSGGGCTDFGQTVYAVADGVVVEVVDGLGSYLDVVVIQHEDPQVGTVYSMYGHISREAGLAPGQVVDYRQPIGFIDDVLAHFSPCHLHFELLSEVAYSQGPFCNGCEGLGYNVSPGYDQQLGVTLGTEPSGDTWLEVNDGIANNRWYHADAFIDARLDASCGECGDGACDLGETYESCAVDCDPCALLPAEGGTLDDAGPCFDAFGPDKYWNVETELGFEGSVRWTHTTDSRLIDNYGVWSMHFAESGSYRLEVFVPEGSADSMQARYEVTHARGSDTAVVDQTAGDWLLLGEYDFAAGAQHTVRLNDNTGEPFADLTRLAFDGVRLTRLDIPEATGTSVGDSGSSGAASDTSGGASSDSAGADGAQTGAPSMTTTTDAGGTGSGALPTGASPQTSGGCSVPDRPETPWGLDLALLGFLGVLGRRR